MRRNPKKRACMTMAFGLAFPDHTPMVTPAELTQIDDVRWYLDLWNYFGPTYTSIKQVCIFLTSPNFEGKLLVVYMLPSHQSTPIFCGILNKDCPCIIFDFPWEADERLLSAHAAFFPPQLPSDAAVFLPRLPPKAPDVIGPRLGFTIEDSQTVAPVSGVGSKVMRLPRRSVSAHGPSWPFGS